MKKIKKFRLNPRPSYVMRGLKSLRGNGSVPEDVEQAAQKEIQGSASFYATAALYKTFAKGELPLWADPLWKEENEKGKKPVAVTFYVTTIGSLIEEEIQSTMARGDGARGQILTCLAEELADQSVNFISRLIADEAKAESCEISAKNNTSVPETQRDIQGLLGSERIDVAMDSRRSVTVPRYTRTGYVLWWPPTKGRR